MNVRLSLLFVVAACSSSSSPNDMTPCTTISGVCLYPPSAPPDRTQCGDVTEFCDKTGVTAPNEMCKAPGTGPTAVTLTGFVHVFSSGPDSKGTSVDVFDAAPLHMGTSLGASTPLTKLDNVQLDPTTERACDADGQNGCTIPSTTGCMLPVCNDGLDGRADNKKYCRANPDGTTSCNDRLRWEARYTMPATVPTNQELVVRVSGPGGAPDSVWAAMVTWNITIAADARACTDLQDNECLDLSVPGSPKYQLNVNALSQADYVNIPVTSGLSGGITPGKGAVAGEIHDCDNVRIENAVVGMIPSPDRFTYFNGNPIMTLPDASRLATDRLGLYAGLNLPPGKVTVVSAGLIGGTLMSLGTFSGYVYADTVSIFDIKGPQ